MNTLSALVCFSFFVVLVQAGCSRTTSTRPCAGSLDWTLYPGSESWSNTGGWIKVYVQQNGYYCRAEWSTLRPIFNEAYPNDIYECTGTLGEGTDVVIKHSGTDGFSIDRMHIPKPNDGDIRRVSDFRGVNAYRDSGACHSSNKDRFKVDCAKGQCRLAGNYVGGDCNRLDFVKFYE
mmetsp:Transcript_12783/g.15927  ORF Transcript_12783/g.15927 Transcript_12783/m.15927 type:complete len:177 (-) Transcript_12783:603-1133(-)|eukprot:CAMPEP_0206198932 /NCGR_PEP_ID=MMETSP0166-20121206/9937_1 /ASSEMBLY_ACC=CAM_ASM_000260 /TAXON_ID=95228 /ORGANISM="Vannella robusta, Strain DIVA3 518/3/11/1/6" /LENGTH=176 /DNA_ID=CAMNT_0053616891 /DNA_START=431 /DNA_END=961 /DNA_ORIENTATION=-